MRVVPALAWRLEGDDGVEPLHERLLPLLDAIDGAASLAAAVRECGMSYRAGWGLLRDYEDKLGEPLVRLQRGRGASLAPAGQRLVAARRLASRRLAPILAGLGVELGVLGVRAATAKPASKLRLRVAASHDLALAALAGTLPSEAALELDLSFMGSLQALDEYAAGRADAAGFHVPIADEPTDRRPFLARLRARRDRLVRFVDREQGLVVAHGNPHRVKSFRDIAAKRLRFVNRQRGSGTRLLVDRMLTEGRIDATAIDGYRTEEFTHAAVAATVASGGADAGFGLRAAAAEYRLGFVPLVRERYFLAIRSAALETPAVQRLLGALRGPAVGRIARQLPGYDATAVGEVAGVEALGALHAPAKRL